MRLDSPPSQRALVIFGETEIKWFRFLKKGFRHCFAIIEGRTGWAVYNPLSHYTEIKMYPSLGADELVRFYDAMGYTVVETRVREPARKMSPVAPFTCVEAVKRALGIQARYIATPWQLFRFLMRLENEKK